MSDLSIPQAAKALKAIYQPGVREERARSTRYRVECLDVRCDARACRFFNPDLAAAVANGHWFRTGHVCRVVTE